MKSSEMLDSVWTELDDSPLLLRYFFGGQMPKLTKTLIRQTASDPDRDFLIYDSDQRGFGLRVYRSGTMAYFFEYSLPGWRSPRRFTIARVGDLTLDQARAEAGRLRALVATGEDPAEEKRSRLKAPTVKDLAERFMREHAPKRAPGTRRNYRLIWDGYLLPALGSKKVAAVRWEDLAKLHHEMRDTPYMANRVIAQASKAWSLAKKWRWYPRELENPARDHDRYPERVRGQALTREELRRVGQALEEEAPGSISAAALTVLMLTGCRPAEILKLRWKDLEGRVLHLSESKTGPRTAYLGAPAAAIVQSLPRIGPYVFPGRKPESPMADLNRVWGRIKPRAKLPARVRLYDATRHTFTTYADELGIPEDRRRRLVGHSLRGVHSRYTHPRHEVLLADADRVAGAIWAAMQGEERGKVVEFSGRTP